MRNKKKKNVHFSIYVLLGMVIALTILITVHQLTPAGLNLFFPNPAPRVIPGLREWQGGTGTFTIGMTSRITVDPAYAAQLQETTQVFQSDLFQVTGHPLQVVTSSSPATGDFYLTLRNTDPVIGNEGYLFQNDQQIRAGINGLFKQLEDPSAYNGFQFAAALKNLSALLP